MRFFDRKKFRFFAVAAAAGAVIIATSIAVKNEFKLNQTHLEQEHSVSISNDGQGAADIIKPNLDASSEQVDAVESASSSLSNAETSGSESLDRDSGAVSSSSSSVSSATSSSESAFQSTPSSSTISTSNSEIASSSTALIPTPTPEPTPATTMATVPYVVGMEQTEATSLLTSLGLNFQVWWTSEHDYTAEHYYVLGQSIEAGTEVDTGTLVRLEIAPETTATSTKVTVPYVIGMEQTEATLLLTGLGLEFQVWWTKEHDISSEVYYIIGQSIDAGTEVDSGTLVRLELSPYQP